MRTSFIRKTPALLPILLLTAAIFITCAPSTSPTAGKSVTLTIIHTNDVHGRTGAEPFIARMASDLRGRGQNVLLLDAGDRLHGQTTANLSRGEAMVSIMNATGYSAMAPGNHDFNFGVERLTELAETMNFPLISANVRRQDGGNLFKPYEIFRMDGIAVGIFGITTPETKTSADPRIVAGLTFDDPVQAAEDIASKLKEEGCDIIIALTHLGSDALAAVHGIDLIVDGHSHDLFGNGNSVNNTLIVQAGEHSRQFGIVEVSISKNEGRPGGKEATMTARIVTIPNDDSGASGLLADSAIIVKIMEEEAKIAPITSAVVGSTPVPLQGDRDMVRTRRTNLTDLVANSMLHATGADAALLTGGNIRAGIEAGEITMGQVLSVLPFSNLLVTVELSGAGLLNALEHGVALYPEPSARYIHTAGLDFEFDPNAPPSQRITKATLADGSALNPDRTYTIATIEFIAAGGDGYDMLANGKNMIWYGGDAEALANYLAANPQINP